MLGGGLFRAYMFPKSLRRGTAWLAEDEGLVGLAERMASKAGTL